jgi:hypothetical protein
LLRKGETVSETILKGRPKVLGSVEIVRSFTYKLNVGNYESRDFFCSQKAECKLADAMEVSEALYQFCKQQVMRAVNDYMKDQATRESVRRSA